MADRGVARQAIDHFASGKGIADQPEPALGVEAGAVERDDAGCFLTAVLQGVQAQRRDRGSVGVTENTEYAAFFAQPVGVEVEERSFCHDHRSAIISMHDSPHLGQRAKYRPARRLACRARYADPVQHFRASRCPPDAAFSASLRWCFPGLPATSTSAIGPFRSERSAIWRF